LRYDRAFYCCKDETAVNSLLYLALGTVAVILALGMVSAVYFLGAQAKHIDAGRQSISLKSLAKRSVKADRAEQYRELIARSRAYSNQ
jgi:hypothetical protein